MAPSIDDVDADGNRAVDAALAGCRDLALARRLAAKANTSRQDDLGRMVDVEAGDHHLRVSKAAAVELGDRTRRTGPPGLLCR